jgi:hypothetical protein
MKNENRGFKNIIKAKKACNSTAHSNRRRAFNSTPAFGIAPRAVLLYVLEGFTPSSARLQDNNYYCTRLVEGLRRSPRSFLQPRDS